MIANRYSYEERKDDLPQKYKNEKGSDFPLNINDTRVHYEIRKFYIGEFHPLKPH